MENRIKELRKERKLSQGRLAELCDTSTQQISRLEKGDRRLSDFWLEKLAEALNCDPVEILTPNVKPAPMADPTLYRDLRIALLDKLYNDEIQLPGRYIANMLDRLEAFASQPGIDQDPLNLAMKIVEIISEERDKFRAEKG